MSGRYINPYTDFGFKYLFGTEPNKENTLELVNALLQGREHIRSLTLIPTEQLGDTQDDRRSVFDVYCENEQGDKIIRYIRDHLPFDQLLYEHKRRNGRRWIHVSYVRRRRPNRHKSASFWL